MRFSVRRLAGLLFFLSLPAVYAEPTWIVKDIRYLNFDKWEQIAVDMGYSMDWLFAIHRAALKNIEIPERQQ